MGKPTGFLEYNRELPSDRPPEERVKDWGEFHLHLHPEQLQEQDRNRLRGELAAIAVQGAALLAPTNGSQVDDGRKGPSAKQRLKHGLLRWWRQRHRSR